jgi:transmembrane sensor
LIRNPVEKAQRKGATFIHPPKSSIVNDNLITFPAKARIREEAALWIAKLDGGPLSTEDADALRAWLTTDVLHRDGLLKLASTFDETNVLADLAELFPLHKDVRHRFSNTIRQFRLRLIPASAIAASLALLLLVTVVANKHESVIDKKLGTSNSAYQTTGGEQQSYSLSDGSIISLNTNSLLVVDFTSSERAVRLISGEVNFDVAKNSRRPFVVYTSMSRIRAVGTAFSVRLFPGTVDVTVTEGKVELDIEKPVAQTGTSISPASESVETRMTLAAGQTAQFTSKDQFIKTISPTEIARKLSWQQGILIFEGETLAEAVKEIGRYTRSEILIADEELGHIRVGGYFKSDDIDATLRTLEDNFNIKVNRVAPDHILLSARD